MVENERGSQSQKEETPPLARDVIPSVPVSPRCGWTSRPSFGHGRALRGLPSFSLLPLREGGLHLLALRPGTDVLLESLPR